MGKGGCPVDWGAAWRKMPENNVIPYDFILFYLQKKVDTLGNTGIMRGLGNIQPRPAAAVSA